MGNRAGKDRSIGFYLAGSVALLCVIGVAVIFTRAMIAGDAGTADQGFEDAGQAFEGQDIREGFGASGLHVQVMDKDDRTRLAAELRSDTIEPLQAQRYRVGEPRATVYLDDGRIVEIAARSGSLVMPDRADAPESGRLSGEVVIRLFEKHADGRRIDPSVDLPAMVWEGEALTFDSTLGEVSTDQPFVLTAAEFEFRAADAKMLINQSLERLERFTVRRGGTIVQRPLQVAMADPPPEPRVAGDPPPSPSVANGKAGAVQPTTAQADTPEQPAPPEPVTTFYQAAMRGDVTLARASQSIQSDRLDLYARTVNNKLPDGAIARFAPAESGADEAGQNRDEGAGTGAAVENEQPADQPTPAQDEATDGGPASAPAESTPDVSTLTWTGTLEVTPMASQPPELDSDDLFARFTSGASGVVHLADASSDARGRAALIEYGLTSQVLVLSGPGQQNIELTSSTMGVARMGHFVLPLATGMGNIAGPGEFVDPDGGRIDWNSRADLIFHVAGGRIVGELREAICYGGAEASDAGASLQAEVLHAYFDTEIDGESRLRRVEARENASLTDGRGSGGRADGFTIAFAADSNGDPQPSSFEANGSADLRQPGARVRADHLHAQLRSDDQGDIEVAKAWAEGAVHFERFEDDIEIRSEHLYADVDAELLEVEGLRDSDADTERAVAHVTRGQTTISGEWVRLHGTMRTADAKGQGSFEHRAGRGAERSHIFARWTEGMSYDDITGRLACVGGVHAVHEPDPLSRDIIDAELLRVDLAPLGETASETEAVDIASLEGAPSDDREVLRVHAGGGQMLGMPESLATVESARFAAGGGESPTLERALRLSGVEIIADNTARTIDVPGRGRLFVADLREGTGEDDRGAALFDWEGSFHADRSTGEATMHQAVQMSHNRASDGAKTVLECGDLLVRFTPDADDDAALGGLRSAIAERDVYLRTDEREIAAGFLHYEPDAGLARALAPSGGRVRIVDSSGAPTSASAIVWDLTADRIDVVDPGSIVIPRID